MNKNIQILTLMVVLGIAARFVSALKEGECEGKYKLI